MLNSFFSFDQEISFNGKLAFGLLPKTELKRIK